MQHTLINMAEIRELYETVACSDVRVFSEFQRNVLCLSTLTPPLVREVCPGTCHSHTHDTLSKLRKPHKHLQQREKY